MNKTERILEILQWHTLNGIDILSNEYSQKYPCTFKPFLSDD